MIPNTPEAQLEIAAWNSHRAGQRRRRSQPIKPVRRTSGRMVETLRRFDVTMARAEKHRKILRDKYGMTDFQIGNAVLAQRKPRGPYHQLAAAVLAAKTKLLTRRRKHG